MKKTFFSILLVLVLVLSLTCPTFAEEATETPGDATGNTGTTVDTPPVPENVPESENEAATVLVTDWLAEHFGDVAAAVGAVVAAVLVWMFKKGLLPAVLKSLSHVKESAEKYSGEFKEETKAVVALLECAERRLQESDGKIEELLSRYQEQQNATAEAYELQTELINYIMMNLRIPNELKAEISNRTAEIKAAIEAAKTKEG